MLRESTGEVDESVDESFDESEGEMKIGLWLHKIHDQALANWLHKAGGCADAARRLVAAAPRWTGQVVAHDWMSINPLSPFTS